MKREKTSNTICCTCGKSFYLPKKRIPKGNEKRFCSLDCKYKYQRMEYIKKIEKSLNIKDLEEYLYDLYINKFKSTREISEILYSNQKNHSSVLSWLKYYNIPLRKGGEAIKTQYLGEKGAKRKSTASKNAKVYLNLKESRENLKKVMQTKEYKLKQRVTKLGKKNGMYGVSGELHPQWNPDRTHEQRVIERKTFKDSRWRKEVFERDKYICKCCGYEKGNILIAHHLNSYDIYMDGRYDVDNGITLCEKCHKDFHHQYGYGKNTKEQFNKWILSKSATA